MHNSFRKSSVTFESYEAYNTSEPPELIKNPGASETPENPEPSEHLNLPDILNLLELPDPKFIRHYPTGNVLVNIERTLLEISDI